MGLWAGALPTQAETASQGGHPCPHNTLHTPTPHLLAVAAVRGRRRCHWRRTARCHHHLCQPWSTHHHLLRQQLPLQLLLLDRRHLLLLHLHCKRRCRCLGVGRAAPARSAARTPARGVGKTPGGKHSLLKSSAEHIHSEACAAAAAACRSRRQWAPLACRLRALSYPLAGHLRARMRTS